MSITNTNNTSPLAGTLGYPNGGSISGQISAADLANLYAKYDPRGPTLNVSVETIANGYIMSCGPKQYCAKTIEELQDLLGQEVVKMGLGA